MALSAAAIQEAFPEAIVMLTHTALSTSNTQIIVSLHHNTVSLDMIYLRKNEYLVNGYCRDSFEKCKSQIFGFQVNQDRILADYVTYIRLLLNESSNTNYCQLMKCTKGRDKREYDDDP